MKSLILLTLLASACLAHANQPPDRHGPPQEFFDACKGKKDGDTAELKNRRGDTVKGTCRLVLLPFKPPGGDEAPRPPR